MQHGHFPSRYSFTSLMASLRDVQEDPDPDASLERMQTANRKLREATARLKASNARMESHLAELRLCVARMLASQPTSDDKPNPS